MSGTAPVWIVRGAAPITIADPTGSIDYSQFDRYIPEEFKTPDKFFYHHVSPPTIDVGIGVAFHQDSDYMPAWVVGIAITPSTPENGSPRFVAKEHEQRFVDKLPCPACHKAWPNCEYSCPRLKVFTFAPGDMWAFRAETWHAVAANFTPVPREVAYFRYKDLT